MTEKNERSLFYKITFFFFAVFIITSGISITVSQISLIITFLFWIYGCLNEEKGFRYNKTGIEKYIIQFIIVSFVLCFITPRAVKNLFYLQDFWLISAFILASSLIDSETDIKKIIYLFITALIIQSVSGYIQYYLDINYLNAYKLGLNNWRSKILDGHIMGFLGQHLTFAGYMMLISIPVFFLAVLKKKDNQISSLLTKAVSIMAFITIILSWARSVILSFPFAAAPLLFNKRKIFIIIFPLILIISFFIFSALGPAKNITNNLNNINTQIRIQIWENAFNVWKEYPVFGTGGGNYDDEFRKIVIKDKKNNELFLEYFPSQQTHAHNDYLNQMARKGVIGLLSYLFMLYGLFKFMLENLNTVKNKFLKYLYMGFFGSFTAFLFASMFQCYFTDEEPLAAFWLNIGLLASIVTISQKEAA